MIINQYENIVFLSTINSIRNWAIPRTDTINIEFYGEMYEEWILYDITSSKNKNITKCKILKPPVFTSNIVFTGGFKWSR